MESAFAKETKRETSGKWPKTELPAARLEIIDHVLVAEGKETQRETKNIKKHGGSDKVVAFGRGVGSGLKFGSKLVHSARAGKIVDRKGHTHKQKKGSVI
jgi:hypothetical protein